MRDDDDETVRTDEGPTRIGRNGVQAVERAVRLLEVLAAAGTPRTMQDLAAELGCSPSTAHRITATLAQSGLLQFNPVTRRYGLGAGITRLAKRRAAQFDLASVAQPFMNELRAATDETVSLWVRSNDAKVCVAVSEGSHEIRQYVAVGTLAPMELSPGSRVLMADETRETVRRWVRGILGEAAAVEAAAVEATVLAEVAGVRRTGVVMLSDEPGNRHHPDVATVAAPIFGDGGAIVAALVVAGPNRRFTGDRMRDSREPLKAEALAISSALGGDPGNALS
ncbi:IclR family transcriptional regulator [Pseudonocardia ailaonensis]|uniref:IclR family transcriptional regulator n=1 Tax=Pseudonocardia ailaonensis TaxID=367279 RepID=A0ABN2NCU6_9PSEU